MSIDSSQGITGLKGALRYVRAYRDHVFVVKLGGDVLRDPAILDQVAAQLALLSSLSIRLVVIHGGGPQANELTRRLGGEPKMVAGRRVTDDLALDVVKMVYAGQLNIDL
ncbi:MAG: acetylglutamate kinase, partial [Gemmatimonadales bacterium]